MFRFLGVGVVLLAVASTGFAGEHYAEIWNPPEARLVHPPAIAKPKSDKASPFSRHTLRATPRQVADPVAKSFPSARAGASSTKSMTPRPTNIPRIITPEGNVLRVRYGDTPVSVIR